MVDGRQAVDERDAETEHRGSGGDAVGADDDGAVALHEVLVEQDPAERDDEGEDDEEVAGEGGVVGAGGMAGAERDEGGADGGDGEGNPAGGVHAFVGEEGGGDGEQDGHGADHQRGMRDGGAVEAGELDEELERDSEEGAEEEGAPLAAIEGWACA